MKAEEASPSSRRDWHLGLGLSAGLLAQLAWDQAKWWSTDPDLSYGFLALPCCAIVVGLRWAPLRQAVRDLQSSRGQRLRGPGGALLAAAALVLAAAGSLGVWMGSRMDADSPLPLPAATFIDTVGTVALVSGLLFLCLPASAAEAATLPEDSRFRVMGLLVFPLGIWLITARPMGGIESALSQFLQNQIVRFVSHAFDLVGLAIVREGNVLVLPKGRVGIAEACSGIRSLTGCVFAGAFLGAILLREWGPKLLLLGCAVTLAVLANLLRSLILTAFGYRYGPARVEGFLHDATGYAVLAGTAAGLLLLVRLTKWLGEVRLVRSREQTPP